MYVCLNRAKNGFLFLQDTEKKSNVELPSSLYYFIKSLSQTYVDVGSNKEKYNNNFIIKNIKYYL